MKPRLLSAFLLSGLSLSAYVYADCFAAAIAGQENVLVTADVKDFKKIPWLQVLALPKHLP